MIPYAEMTTEMLQAEYAAAKEKFEACKSKSLKLNMARGKPSKVQLDIAAELLTVIQKPEDCFDGEIDARNYGELAGLPCARAYWADVLGCKPQQTVVGGSASLNLMFDVIARAYSHGLLHSPRPWCKEETVKFLCPSPGYDRHFRITEFFGAELITVPMTEEGPDMDLVEKLVEDSSVKGIWCVPKYSNPDGIIYSDTTIRRLAGLKAAAPDFLLMWDNAYCVHEFDGEFIPFADIISVCEEAGNPDMVYEFASTSKVSFAGSGIAAVAASVRNLDFMRKSMTIQTIGYDKINQLRHVKYFKNLEGLKEQMKKHADIMRPKFEAVLSILDRELGGLGIAEWIRPKGGYFISFEAMEGCAKAIVAKCKEAGVVMTGAGATFPYGKDPKDTNIRIAPSFPTPEEMAQAAELFVLCVKLISVEKLLEA